MTKDKEPTQVNPQQQGDPQPQGDPNPEGKQPKTFTREQIGGIVDKQVATKLDEINSDWQKKLDEAVAKAKEDGKAEATMSAKELAEKQAKDREEQFKKQQDALNERQKELDHRDHIAHTKDLLAEEHLPTERAEMLLGETEEETKKNIESFKELVNQGVRNALHKSSAGKAPQAGSPAQVEAPKKDMADMTYAEMQKYIESQQN